MEQHTNSRNRPSIIWLLYSQAPNNSKEKKDVLLTNNSGKTEYAHGK